MSTSQVLPRPATSRSTVRPREHYAGLDGLRAFAIISVLVFHLNASWLPGGFLGVDVFFVISGFLITSLLAREIADHGRVDLRGFFTRRARRLIPALAACVFIATLVARAVSPDLVVGIGRQVLGAATFSTNWLEIASGQSYFDQTAPILFMNLWSLAVEEQFYLLWPIVTFVLLVRFGRRARYIAPLTVAAFSTLSMALLFTPGEDATRVYYGTDTHLMGLMLGATLAFGWAGPWRPTLEVFALRHRAWLGPVALGALVLAMALLTDDSAVTYRGGFTLVSAVTAVLVLATVCRGVGGPTWFQRAMDGRVVTWIGRRSYGLYLWHWPAIVVVDGLVPSAPGTVAFAITRAAAVIATVAIAEASFHLIEEPIRKHGFRATGRRIVAVVRSQSVARARALVALSAATALCFTGVVATAPALSETARVLIQNAEAAEPATAEGPVPAEAQSPVVPDPAAIPSAAAPSTPDPSATPVPADPGTTPGPQASPSPSASGPVQQDWSMPAGAEIDGFGDSMMVASVPALKHYFPGIRLDAESNRRWAAGLAAIEARGPETRRAAVVHFGLNAGTRVEDVTAALDALGPDRMVVVVNLYGTFARVESDNAALAKAVEGRRNVVVADWRQVVRDDPRAVQSDKKHPSQRGSHLYARAIQRAFATLSERQTGQAVVLTEHPLPAR